MGQYTMDDDVMLVSRIITQADVWQELIRLDIASVVVDPNLVPNI